VKHGTYQLLPNKAPAMSDSPLLSASDGNLYGVSEKGGKYHQGTIYRMSLAGAIHVVHSFNGADGDAPQSALIQAKDGTFFGTTGGGGSSIWGTVFSFTLAPATLNTLWSFNGTDGALPIGGLVMGLDGSLYGTTLRGGINGVGNIFEISSPESSPVFADLFDFADSGEVGVTGDRPYTGLKLDTNGTIYGLTGEGGAGGDGVFFSLSVPNPTFNITLCCNWWLILDQPVLVLGQGLTGAVAVNFGGVPAQFSVGSDTYLTAAVPNTAIDGPITVTLATGLQLQSQQNAHILPDVAGLDPPSGPSGTLVSIVGGGFAGTSSVTFDGMPAADFTVISPALIQAVVPAGAASGKVEVVTPNGKSKSPKSFIVN
jgi:uncharacterized repeat protein (TIGR03803 family)